MCRITVTDIQIPQAKVKEKKTNNCSIAMAANTSTGNVGAENSMWTWEEDKKFECGLVEFPDGTPNRWEKIAASVGNKTAAEVERHYAILLEDIAAIEAGLVEMPPYPDMDIRLSPEPEPRPNPGKKPAAAQRKAGKPWSEEEHRLFLLGLEKYGKGDWKSISRYVVLTRNPTQVASHAQKYFERQDREDPGKKRRSIFDGSTSGSGNKPADK